MYQFPTGMEVLKPSKQMRDWSKFAWKKGDVLEDQYGHFCIFEEWANEDYTKFNACYANSKYGDHYYSKLSNAETMKYKKVCEEASIRHIKEIEKNLDGKLNLDTLGIEQPKPEFKDGDIVVSDSSYRYNKVISIITRIENGNIYYSPSITFDEDHYDDIDFREYKCFKDEVLHLATDSEKQQLFSALEKEGKRWNSETKQIEDLPKKCEFKTLDYVLMKTKGFNGRWLLAQYSFSDSKNVCFVGGLICCIDEVSIIPYNDSTKHLLGTNDEWKGGEE